jgi:hypothetical protein
VSGPPSGNQILEERLREIPETWLLRSGCYGVVVTEWLLRSGCYGVEFERENFPYLKISYLKILHSKYWKYP